MNSVNFKIVKSFIRSFLFSFCFFAQVKVSAMDVPTVITPSSETHPAESHEVPETQAHKAPAVPGPQVDLASAPVHQLASAPAHESVETNNDIAPPKRKVEKSTDSEIVHALQNVVNPVETAREIVIVNTESGFVPDVVHVKKGEFYKIHVVNLNMKEKNTSFLMDSFTQSHNTVYGNLKTFTIEPKLEGVFSYQCPETGVQGRIVVVNEAKGTKSKVKSVRRLASEE